MSVKLGYKRLRVIELRSRVTTNKDLYAIGSHRNGLVPCCSFLSQGKKIKIRLLVKRSSEDKQRENLLKKRRQTLIEEKEQKVKAILYSVNIV